MVKYISLQRRHFQVHSLLYPSLHSAASPPEQTFTRISRAYSRYLDKRSSVPRFNATCFNHSLFKVALNGFYTRIPTNWKKLLTIKAFVKHIYYLWSPEYPVPRYPTKTATFFFGNRLGFCWVLSVMGCVVDCGFVTAGSSDFAFFWSDGPSVSSLGTISTIWTLDPSSATPSSSLLLFMAKTLRRKELQGRATWSL